MLQVYTKRPDEATGREPVAPEAFWARWLAVHSSLRRSVVLSGELHAPEVAVLELRQGGKQLARKQGPQPRGSRRRNTNTSSAP
jgi:hypothetical protein